MPVVSQHLLDNNNFQYIVFSLLHRLFRSLFVVMFLSWVSVVFLCFNRYQPIAIGFHIPFLPYIISTAYRSPSAHIAFYYRVFICVHTCSIVAFHFIIIFRLCSDCCGFLLVRIVPLSLSFVQFSRMKFANSRKCGKNVNTYNLSFESLMEYVIMVVDLLSLCV